MAELDFVQQNLLGQSPPFLRALRLIRRIAVCDAPTLIQGETGTGKELAARAIHYLGRRNSGAFVAVNCGAIPETLVESELFGHVRGAFTDAKESQLGLVAQARKGTLFLDELESLSLRGQVALMRFLQDQEYRPLGGALVRDADVRIIASTNTDLHAMVAGGGFRGDLLFRLSVLVLYLPPLRERVGDAVLLADHFIRRFSTKYSRLPKPLDEAAREYLGRHTWPGNVRELENLVHRECLLSDGPSISFGAISLGAGTVQSQGTDRQSVGEKLSLTDQVFRQAKAKVIADFERAYLTEVLNRSGGNVSLAARLSGKERSRFGKLVKKYGLQPTAVVPGPGRDARRWRLP